MNSRKPTDLVNVDFWADRIAAVIKLAEHYGMTVDIAGGQLVVSRQVSEAFTASTEVRWQPPTAEAQQQPETETPCGPAPDQCDAEAGDPCANHEREQAHDEGEHCFCGPECDEAQQQEPPVHGESVAHLAGLHGRRDQWADDEQADTLPAWLYQRFMVSGVGWDNLDEDDRSYWEHHARAVRRAVARGGFKQPAVDARQDGACPAGCIACATDESHDPTWAQQDGEA